MDMATVARPVNPAKLPDLKKVDEDQILQNLLQDLPPPGATGAGWPALEDFHKKAGDTTGACFYKVASVIFCRNLTREECEQIPGEFHEGKSCAVSGVVPGQ
jgi:hypothetical protein